MKAMAALASDLVPHFHPDPHRPSTAQGDQQCSVSATHHICDHLDVTFALRKPACFRPFLQPLSLTGLSVNPCDGSSVHAEGMARRLHFPLPSFGRGVPLFSRVRRGRPHQPLKEPLVLFGPNKLRFWRNWFRTKQRVRLRGASQAVRPRLEVLEDRTAPTADFGFALSAGGAGVFDMGDAVATDAAGNVYVTGAFYDTVDFDPSAGTVNLTSAGLNDVFVAKYTSAGALVWARQLGGSGGDHGTGVAVDGQGKVYITGLFSDTADFDPGAGTFNLTSAGS